MQVSLSPTWELTTNDPASSNGQPVLVNTASQQAFGPGDTMQMYPSYGFMTAAAAVRRATEKATFDEAGKAFIEKFCQIAGVTA